MYSFNNNKRLQQEFERNVLYGLQKEWYNVIDLLPDVYRRKARFPIFGIKDLTNRLGYWSLENREICFSRDLILNHPWDSICEVLRHEMAHQFAHEIFYAYDDPPHGKTFRKVCDLINANPEASGSNPTLHQRIEKIQNSGNKIIDKIKKLMALAESQNQHEAQSAMLKAQELISKYNIQNIKEKQKQNYVSIFLGDASLRHTRDEYRLSSLLQEYYFVYGIWIPSYVIKKQKMGRVLEISGTAHNVTIAHYVYDYVRNYINIQWKKYNKKKTLTYHRKTDYAIGIIDGFETTLEKTKLNDISQDDYALIKTQDPLLKQYIKKKYPRIRSFSNRAYEDQDVKSDGHIVGQSLVISKGISQKNENQKGIIEWNK